MKRLRPVAVLALLVATTAACGAPTGDPSEGAATSPAASDDAPSLPTVRSSEDATPAPCGRVPGSTGPLSTSARLVLSAAGEASPGGRLSVRTTVVAGGADGRFVASPASSALLITSGDRVVARSVGDGPDAPLLLGPGRRLPGQAVPASVRLVGCSAAGTALPAGSYTLVGVLAYRLDPRGAAVDGGPTAPGGGRTFVLVSAPLPLEVG